MARNIGPSIRSLLTDRKGVITMTERPQERHDDDSRDPAIASMTEEQRRARILELSHEIADWSAELNRRLA